MCSAPIRGAIRWKNQSTDEQSPLSSICFAVVSVWITTQVACCGRLKVRASAAHPPDYATTAASTAPSL